MKDKAGKAFDISFWILVIFEVSDIIIKYPRPLYLNILFILGVNVFLQLILFFIKNRRG